MRIALWIWICAAVLVAHRHPLVLAAPPVTVQTASRAAMQPYYAALLSSAHGDGEGTLRHVLVLASRWRAVTRASASESSSWPHEVVAGRPLVEAVTSIIGTARGLLPRDVSGAHAELERIRVLLRDARARHDARNFDDAVTDYHEAMERLTNHIGGRNEIALTADEFSAIRDLIGRTRAAWSDVLSRMDPVPSSEMLAAADHTTAALKASTDAAVSRDGGAAQKAAELLRSRYFELLAVLSRT